MEDDGKTWAQYLMEEKSRRDRVAGLKYAEEKGIIKVAKELFKLGLPLDVIKDATELSDKELTDIQKNSQQPSDKKKTLIGDDAFCRSQPAVLH